MIYALTKTLEHMVLNIMKAYYQMTCFIQMNVKLSTCVMIYRSELHVKHVIYILEVVKLVIIIH